MGFPKLIDHYKKKYVESVFVAEGFATDTLVFRLHYRLSAWLVVLYSIGFLFVQIGSPISCLGSKEDEVLGNNQKLVNDFCWVHGTYAFMNVDNFTGREVYPGVHGLTSRSDHVFYHQYYKWMYFYIIFMLILLHVPRQIWRFIEAGRMKSLANRLTLKGKMAMALDAEIEKEEGNLVDYLFTHLGYHRVYAFGFLFCEFLNVGVSTGLLQMWDLISDHQLSTSGLSSFQFLQTPLANRTDALARVFPLISKCTFNSHGPGGNIVPRDIICVLPLNVVNQFAAVLFWFYFMALIAVGVAEIVFRMVLICCKPLRARILRGASLNTPVQDIKLIAHHSSYSDWFVLDLLNCCLDPEIRKRVFRKYADKLRSKCEIA